MHGCPGVPGQLEQILLLLGRSRRSADGEGVSDMPIRTEPVLPEDDWQLRLEPPTDGSGVGTLTLDYPEKLNMW